MSLVEYFTDPVLRAPTIGSLLMCLSASLVGVIVFLRRQSLIGEVLSHASYPGVILGITLIGSLSIDPEQQLISLTIVLFCASLTAWLGLKMIHWMTHRLKIRQDASLCFTLSTFFGVGLCLASEIQFAYPSFYKQVLSFLFGQVATMTEIHVMAYTLLAVVVCGVIFSFYKELKVTLFDRHLAKSLGLNVGLIDEIVTILIVIAVVAGIRSVGVVLMAAMLIAPAIAARQYTHSLSTLFILSGIFGLISGFGGTYLSFEFSMYWGSALNQRFSFPSGPMIVLTASLITLLSLFIAPEKGILFRYYRMLRFRWNCVSENILKSLWGREESFNEILSTHDVSRCYLLLVLWRLKHQGWLRYREGVYVLTSHGERRAKWIIRLHRLWEVYLADYLGVGEERVHCNAEEMEHILTKDLEKELVALLDNPKVDPHHQPIPDKVGGI